MRLGDRGTRVLYAVLLLVALLAVVGIAFSHPWALIALASFGLAWKPLQVLRYGPGQQYKPHLDALPGLANQRRWTALIYLNDDYEGGETAFLESGHVLRGRTGDMLLFENALPDGRPDPRTRHAGRPVASGIKLLASRWIRERPADPATGFGHHEAERRG